MSDGTAQSIVDGVLAQTGTTVDQTVAQANGIVDQTVAPTEGIVDQTVAQTDGIVDQTLKQTGVDRTVEHATGGGAVPDDRAVAPPDVAPPASNGAADPLRGPATHAPSADTHAAVADPTVGSPRPHADPTAVAAPDLPAAAPHYPDPSVAGPPPADAIVAAPKPPADALAPLPSFHPAAFLDGILDNATDRSTLTAAGIALVVGAGATAVPRGGSLTDSRLMIQIGMMIGFVYTAFVSVWFWATRLRAPTGSGHG
jgi:hypothetical protein